MARQGAYVTGSGSSANWASGIADSLSTLSKSYLDQGSEKEDRVQAAIKDAENNRRYEEGVDYRSTRDALSLKQYDATTALNAANRDEDQKIVADRNVIIDKRFTDKEELARSIREATQNYARNYTSSGARTAAFNANPDFVAASDELLAESIATIGNNFYASNMYEGKAGVPLLEKDIPKDLPQVIESAYAAGTLGEQAYGQYHSDIAAQRKKVADYISTSMPMYQSGASANIYREAMALGASSADASAMATQLSGQYDDKSTLTKAAIASQKTQNDRNKLVADIGFKIWKEKGSNKGTGVSKGPLNELEAREIINSDIDASLFNNTGDNGTLYNQWESAVAEGVNPKIAMEALKNSLDIGFWGTSAKYDSADFVIFAKSFESANTTGGKYTDYTKFLPEQATYVDPMLRNRQAFLGGRQALGVAPSVVLSDLLSGSRGQSRLTTAPLGGSGTVSGTVSGTDTGIDTETAVTAAQPLSRNDMLQRLTSDESYAIGTPLEKDIGKLERKLTGQQESYYTASPQDRKTILASATDTQTQLRHKVEKKTRVDRYAEGKALTDRVNAVIDGGIETETLYVLPYDAEGEMKSWANVVKDINNRESIGLADGIDIDEYEAALDNPEMQRAIIEKVNKLIGNDAVFQASTAKMLDGGAKAFDDYIATPAAEALDSIFATSFDPTSDDYNGVEVAPEGPTRTEILGDVQEFVRQQNGLADIGQSNVGQAWDAATSSISESPSMQNTLLTAAAPAAYGTVYRGVAAANKVAPAVANVFRGIPRLLARPKKVPTPLRPWTGTKPFQSTKPFQGPRRPTRGPADRARLMEWYRANIR